MKRLKIITGHYGSGKTEFSLNYAYELRKTGKKVYIVDVDVINVYFRSREKLDELKKDGIEVLGSNMIKALGSDLPAVDFSFMSKYKAEVDAYFIIDLAGSKNGLNICKTVIDKIDDYEFIMVINTYRNETSNKVDIVRQVKSFENFSSLKVSSFVNNTNLLHSTEFSDLVNGYNILKGASLELDIPIMMTFANEKVVKGKNLNILDNKIFTFDKLKIRNEWL